MYFSAYEVVTEVEYKSLFKGLQSSKLSNLDAHHEAIITNTFGVIIFSRPVVRWATAYIFRKLISFKFYLLLYPTCQLEFSQFDNALDFQQSERETE